MSPTPVLAELERLGTAQNRKVYPRHGVRGPCFGVSYANLEKLRRKHGPDQALARELWKSGNHDARVLATKVAVPEETTAKELAAWVRDIDNYVLTNALSALAARTAHARKLVERWLPARSEWTSATGWQVLACLASDEEVFTERELEGYLARIEKNIHSSPNRVRYDMNSALIAIGLHSPRLQKLAIAAARRIGKVEVDHGETGCKTPDAEPYIRKAAARRRGGSRGKGRSAVPKKKSPKAGAGPRA